VLDDSSDSEKTSRAGSALTEKTEGARVTPSVVAIVPIA
jgi:hypothetical protein